MDTLFHIVFGFIAGMAVNMRLKHAPVYVAAVAIMAVLIDIDHFLFAYSRTFHTVFITVGIPALLFILAYRYEQGSDAIRYQSLVILLFVMLNGHLVADLFGSDLRLLYPLSDTAFGIPATWEITFAKDSWPLIAPEGIVMAVYGTIIAAAYYAEEVIYFVERQHTSIRAALRP